ncbi:extracellular catalytic domain type 1 short-chain-length polyhydroxyalkanoate depolymerase [Actinomadura latina]|nr:PHB depolymerase family esterase [Actinomadura latina]
MRALGVLVAALVAAMAVLVGPPASAASLTEVTDFGTNPSGLRMHLYVPDRVQERPPVLLAVHWCTGSGPAMYSGTEFARLADQYGFIVIYPSATRSGACFDVSSPQALKRDGGSDPVGLMSMVRYTLQRYGGDAARVFVAGVSSGAMMTNVMLADYPDVFAAGAVFAGVPDGCFATADGSEWNSACANGTVLKTPQQWGDIARSADPGYSGPRPRVQLWHGTADDTLRYPNFGEEIDQWTNVHGLSTAPTATDQPQQGWTRTRYGDKVEAYSLQGVGHNLMASGMAQRTIEFFGLDQGGTTEPPDDGGGSADCAVAYSVNAWNTGLVASITITNTGSTAINGWTLGFTLPAGQTITSGWGADYRPASGAVSATNVSYNAAIPAGGSVGIGLQATHSGDTGAPAGFTLNGTACSTA